MTKLTFMIWVWRSALGLDNGFALSGLGFAGQVLGPVLFSVLDSMALETIQDFMFACI